MSPATHSVPHDAWVRPSPRQTGPLRGLGQLYRSAEVPGTTLGGVPLSSAEDAVVAAVRMGYRVAQAQVDKAGRIGERLRSAGERAVGPDPEGQAADATERLVSSALLTGLAWLEGLAAEPGSPLRRYATAQYRLLGALLGLQLGKDEPVASVPPHPEPHPAATRPEAPRSPARRVVSVVHCGGARRPVQVRALQLDEPGAQGEYELLFYGPGEFAITDVAPTLMLAAGRPALLRIETARETPAGVWKAAVCAPEGEQLGWIEIEL